MRLNVARVRKGEQMGGFQGVVDKPIYIRFAEHVLHLEAVFLTSMYVRHASQQ